MRSFTLAFPALALCATPVAAAELKLTVEIPQLKVAEYHKPYVAIWVENQDQAAVANLAVWYDLKLKNNEGETWLKDLRQWWRRSGRELDMPVNGISGATRAPGVQSVTVSGGPLARLPAGQYNLVVEAAREVGGREVVKVPFQWPPKRPQNAQAKGGSELGAVTLAAKP
jgi:hypothetical protein